MWIRINDVSYNFYPNAMSRRKTREGYFRLAHTMFGLNFDKWYDSGFWSRDRFIPYVLYHKGVAVSSVGVCVNEVQWQNTTQRYAQISTVMTLPEYRRRGLNRWLMEYVLREWRDYCDAIYLLGNDSVVDFYPKFGFEEFTEYDFTVPVRKAKGEVKKLDINELEDLVILVQKYRESNPFAALKVNNISQMLFHCMQFLSDDIFYVEQYDAVAIVRHRGNKMTCYDVFASANCRLDDILGVLANESTEYAQLGFTPKDLETCTVVESQEEDNHLYVLPGKSNIFRDHQVMFPLLSRA